MVALTIRDVMTPQPHSIHTKETLEQAQQLMSMYHIRHLPVMSPLNASRVIGIISDRDLKAVRGIPGVNPAKVLVESVYHRNPYVVEGETPLSDVTSMMSDRHYGSAIIIDRGKLVGIFTTVDACRVLTYLLRKAGSAASAPHSRGTAG